VVADEGASAKHQVKKDNTSVLSSGEDPGSEVHVAAKVQWAKAKTV